MKRSDSSGTKSASATTPEMQFYRSPEQWKPHAGQKKGMKFLIEHACAGLFADPGVGKTSIVYGAFKVLKEKRKVAEKMLVIAPLKPCYLVWPKEKDKWVDFNGFRVVVLHGPDKDKLLQSEADVYIINPEGLEWLLDTQKTRGTSGRVSVQIDIARFKKFGFDTLVVDELSKFKNSNSVRFKALKQILPTFKRRWGLTGSPAPNGLIDLFGECYILDMGRSLGQYITHYRQKYFLPSFDGFGWNLRRGAEAEIYERLGPLVCRLDANDYIDMPEVVSIRTVFDLPPKVQEIYNSLEEDMLAKLDNGDVIAASNAAAASMKCRQVANGGLYLDKDLETLVKKFVKSSTRDHVNLHYEKVDLVEDLVDELQGSPLLVAYDFHHDLERLKERFGKDLPYLGGGVSPKKSIEIEALWNKGKLPILAAHPQSVGHGLNLQESGSHVAWHSMTWDFDNYDQFIRRIRRQGHKGKRVFVHHFLAKGTVDEIMYYAMDRKEKGQTALLDALKQMSRKRK